jgi:hypothetical protein
MRGRRDLPSGIKHIDWFKICAQNISLAYFRKSALSPVIPPRSSEGRIAIVTTREAGMRWTLTCLLTSGADADGEIVWSWRPKGWR